MEVERLEIFRPECNTSFGFVNVIAHLDRDLSYILPYLNATQEKAHYRPNHPFLDFVWKYHKVVVEKKQVRISLFEDEVAAREGTKELIDLIREIDDQKGELTPDHTPYDPPTVMEILKLLPKKNSCGKCGYQTCMAFATALASDDAAPDSCTEFENGPQQSENFERLGDLLGN